MSILSQSIRRDMNHALRMATLHVTAGNHTRANYWLELALFDARELAYIPKNRATRAYIVTAIEALGFHVPR